MAVIEPTATNARTDALLRITQAIETATTLDELLLLSLNEFGQLFHLQRSNVILCEDGITGRLLFAFPPQLAPTPPVVSEELVQRVYDARVPLLLAEGLPNEDLSAVAPPVLLVPLIAQDQVTGVLLLLAADTTTHFSDDEIALARLLASLLAAAIVAFRTSEAARRRNGELATLNEIATTVTSTLDTHEVYLLVVQKLNTYFNVDAGSILLIDEATGNLHFVMTIEGGEEKLAGVQVPMGQGVVGHVASSGEWEIVPDVKQYPGFYSKVSDDLGYDTRSILCVPMVAKGRVIGVIELLNKVNGEFTVDDAERLTRMAAFIGVAIQNARLFQQVADGRDRLAAILNSIAEGVIMTDLNGTVLSVNPMAQGLFEASEPELLGRPLEQLVNGLHGRARDLVQRQWGNLDADGDGNADLVTELELGEAGRRFVRYRTLPVRDAAGEDYGHLLVFHDITQERELEQLRQDFTSMLVHDLRAPLTSVMNGIVMVQRGLGGPVTEQQLELLGHAHHGSQTILSLINNLLDISKMEQGHMKIDREPLVPYTIIDAVIGRLDVSARSLNITIEQSLAVGLPLVEADPELIKRVLQNLLDNALKFSSPNGVVTIGAHRYDPENPLPGHVPVHPPFEQGEWLVLWVQDRGPGIPAVYHGRIFEQFGQVRDGKHKRGTGLGLTFCKLAVESHQGRIWLESTVGVGSVFAFALPLSAPDQRP